MWNEFNIPEASIVFVICSNCTSIKFKLITAVWVDFKSVHIMLRTFSPLGSMW